MYSKVIQLYIHINLQISNNIASKYIEQKWTDLQEENDKSYAIIGRIIFSPLY